MRRRTRWISAESMLALVWTTAGTPAPVARADGAPARDPVAAEALYKSGRELLAKGDWAAACPKFASSMQLDPVASTLINVAKCSEHDGKLASAWSELKRAEVLNQETPGEERRRTLGELIGTALSTLESRLPRLKIAIAPRPEGLEVSRDGIVLPLPLLDEEIPLDPGTHVVRATAPGFVPVERSVKAEEGRTATLEIALAEVAKTTVVREPAPLPPDEEPGLPVWPFITGGVGLAAVGVGVGFRIHQAGVESALDDACGVERVCDPRSGYDPADDNMQKNFDHGMFVGLSIAGGAVIAATVIGLLLDRGDEPTSSARAARLVGRGGTLTGEF